MARTKKENLNEEKENAAVNTKRTGVRKRATDSASAEAESVKNATKYSGFDIKDGILKKYKGRQETIVIPDGVVEIAPRAFFQKSIRSVQCPDSLVRIGDCAFDNCWELIEVSLNQGLVEIGDAAFRNCGFEVIVIPDSVKKLGHSLFCGCECLMEVTLPRGIKALPDELFAGCVELERIHQWPEKLKKHGTGIFKECFEDWVPECFRVENGDCVRDQMVPMEVDPIGVFNLTCCSFAMSSVFRLWNMIYRDAVLDKAQADEYMKVCRTCLLVSAILSDFSLFSAYQTIRACIALIELTDSIDGRWRSSARQRLTRDALICTLENIGGSGQSWRSFETLMVRSVFDEGDLYDEDLGREDRFLASILKELEVEVTPNRYHPAIYHHAARIECGEDYWDFVCKIEGLMRFLGLPFTQYSVACDEDDTLDDWLKCWSEAIKETDCCIVRIEDDRNRVCKDSFIAILTHEQARTLYSYFQAVQCESMLDGWIAGRKLFALTLV